MPSSRNSSLPDHRLTILIVVATIITLFPYLVSNMSHLNQENNSNNFQLVATGDILSFKQNGPDTYSSSEGSKNPYLRPFLFEKLPVNSVNDSLLQTIPGIGVELSRRIIEERENNGVYISAEDLTRVRGIGVKKVERLKKQLSFTLLQ